MKCCQIFPVLLFDEMPCFSLTPSFSMENFPFCWNDLSANFSQSRSVAQRIMGLQQNVDLDLFKFTVLFMRVQSHISNALQWLIPLCTQIDFSFSCFEFSPSVSPSSFNIYLPWTKLYSLLKLFLFRLTIAPFSLQHIFGTERRWTSPPMWTSRRRSTGWRSLL